MDEYVNISARVTDNYELASAEINVTDPDGTSVYKGPMDYDSATGRFYRRSSYHKVGNFTFVIEARDGEGNLKQKSGKFTIDPAPVDLEPPMIWEVRAAPDPQEVYGEVNISALVTDNWDVGSVWVHIYDPDAFFLGNYSMVFDGSSGEYFFESSYSMLGCHTLVLWANDTSGNLNSTNSEFTMVDTARPEIRDVGANPDPQETGQVVTISARIDDSTSVEEVWVEVFDPLDTSLGNFSMSFNPPSGRYVYSSAFSYLGLYRFVITATDLSGNTNSTSGTFTIIDTIPPEITNEAVDPEPQEVFGTSQASARVTDNYELSGVWIEITDPQGSNVGNFSMSFSVNVYYYDQTCELIGEYELLISASDSSGNWDSAIVLLHCVDTTHPIVDATAAPDPQEVHGYVNISAQVTENYALDGAWVEIHDPDGLLVGNFSMAFDSSESKYYYRTQYSKLGSYSYVVSAKDTSGNWGAEAATFQMRDTTPPIADAGPDQSVIEGTLVTLDASASTDNYGLAYFMWSFNDETGDVNLSGASVNHVFMSVGSYLVRLYVEDYSGNSATDWLWVNVSKGPAPNPPTNVRVIEFGPDYIVLAWDPPTTNEDGSPLTDLAGYHFYRTYSQGPPYAKLTLDPFTDATRTDSCLHPGFQAYYVFTAVNLRGYESDFSNEVFGWTLSMGSIEGEVVDGFGNAIPDALVELWDDGKVVERTFTDSNGKYSFDGLFSGTYTILGRKAGYENDSVATEVAYGGKTTPDPLVLHKISEQKEFGTETFALPIVFIIIIIAIIALLLFRRRRPSVEDELEELLEDIEIF